MVNMASVGRSVRCCGGRNATALVASCAVLLFLLVQSVNAGAGVQPCRRTSLETLLRQSVPKDVSGYYQLVQISGSDGCPFSISLKAGTSGSDGVYNVPSSDIYLDRQQCGSGGSLEFVPFSDVQNDADLNGQLGQTLQQPGAGLILSYIVQQLSDDLYVLQFNKLPYTCNNGTLEGATLGLYWTASSNSTIGSALQLLDGTPYMILGTAETNGASQLHCWYAHLSDDALPTGTVTPIPTRPPQLPGSENDDSGGSSDTGGGNSCFPADATVELRGGQRVRMDSLAIGDEVRVAGEHRYSPIFMFGHASHQEMATYIRVETEHGETLSISPQHYVPVAGVGLKAAEALRVGDLLTISSSVDRLPARTSTVKVLSRERRRGVFAPHTVEGEVVVDDILVSCYTQALHPRLASLLLTPFRVAFRLGMPSLRWLEAQSRASWARTLHLPTGPATLVVQ